MKWPASRSPRIPVRDSPPSLSELWRAAFAHHLAAGAKAGASGRTRTDEYEFTKLALWLLRHRGVRIYDFGLTIYEPEASVNFGRLVNRKSKIVNRNGALTWICTTNFRLRRAACRTDYTLRAQRSVRCEVSGARCQVLSLVGAPPPDTWHLIPDT